MSRALAGPWDIQASLRGAPPDFDAWYKVCVRVNAEYPLSTPMVPRAFEVGFRVFAAFVAGFPTVSARAACAAEGTARLANALASASASAANAFAKSEGRSSSDRVVTSMTTDFSDGGL